MNVLKLKLLLFSLFVLTDLFGQSDSVLIYGNVSDKDYHTKPDNIMVDLVARDSIKHQNILYRTRTDSLGGYKIIALRKYLTRRSYLLFTQDFPAYKQSRAKDTCCKKFDILFLQIGFGKSTLMDIENLDTINRIQMDILLTPQCNMFSSPVILFNENSYDLTNDTTNSIEFLKCFLKMNPSYTIMVKAHCDFDEKNKQELSEKRALAIKQKLVDLGINPKRIDTKGFSDSNPRSQKNKIKKAFSPEQKETYKALNRRCTISIVSLEFKD